MADGTVRQPRARVVVNGTSLVPIECIVNQSSHKRSDTFSAQIALDAARGFDEKFWSDASPISVQVDGTNDQRAARWTTLFTGDVDEPEIDFFTRVVHIEGRDKTARLIETKTTEKWQNLTTPELVKQIAARVGLTADVVVKNPDKVGLLYKDDYNRISDQDVLYNVLARLAQREGCAMFVKKDRLIFKPVDQLGGGVFTLTYVAPTRESYARGNFVRLTARRNLAVAKNVSVKVQSWRQKTEEQIVAEYESSLGTDANGNGLNYTYRAPNLTKQQADKIAKGRHDEVVNREREIHVDAPGDVDLNPEKTLALEGTGTAFDQSYIISTVRHRFNNSEGYRMSVSTRNHDKRRKGRKAR